MIPNAPTKGNKAPLNQTKQARERVIVALSWDAREDKVNLARAILQTDSQHDLDISCYVYDNEHDFIDFVGAEAQDSMDQSGKIYHSGDNACGSGGGDDEFISVELASLPADVHGMVFMAEVRSNHTFNQVEAPFSRVADGMTDNNLLEVPLNHDESVGKNAFVICSIYRDASNESGWTLCNISEYPDISQIKDWGSYLAQFVD